MTLTKATAEVPARQTRRRRPVSVPKATQDQSIDFATERRDAPEILQRVALDLFAKQNYSTVTIKDIAVSTGFNPSLIYYYFGSKEGLFLKAIELTVDEAFLYFTSISERTKDPEKIISLWIEVHITQYLKLQKLAKISLDYASTHNRSDPADKAIRRFYDQEATVLGAAIKAGMAAGIFRPVNARAVALFISTYLDGALFRSVLFPEFNHRTGIGQMRKIVLTFLKTGELPAPVEART